MAASNALKVFINNCTVNLRVGVRDHEKEKTQRVIVTVEAEAPLTRSYHDKDNDDLSSVMDYSPLHNFVCHELPKKGHIPLLETIGQMIADFCFESEPRIRKVRVRLEKPDVYPELESAGIEMIVTRQGVSAHEP